MAAQVQVAGAGDAELVAKLLRDFNAEFDVPVPDNLEARFAALLPRGDVLVVLAGEVGFALVTLRPSPYYDGPVAMLDELYVAPGHRGRGIGSAIMREVLARVGERGAGEMQINVDAVDEGARRFYERHGFSNFDQGSQMLLYARELIGNTRSHE